MKKQMEKKERRIRIREERRRRKKKDKGRKENEKKGERPSYFSICFSIISYFLFAFYLFLSFFLLNFLLMCLNYFIISQHPRQETKILSPDGLPMLNAAVYF